jgi:hypothetical protein
MRGLGHLCCVPEVQRRSTPLTADRAAAILREAWPRVSFVQRTGVALGDQTLALLLALWDLETAAGRAQANNNWGNIIATRPNEQEFYFADDSGNLRKFRSYADALAGAVGFVGQLLSDTRSHWRDGLLRPDGDPAEFVRALKGGPDGTREQYFEAPLDRYLRTFLERWQKYTPSGGIDPIAPTLPPPKARAPWWGLAMMAGLGFLALRWVTTDRRS